MLAIVTASAGGEPADQVRLIAAVAAAYVAGRLLGLNDLVRAVTAAALACAVLLAVLSAPDGLSGAPLAGPLGYGNANGALCLLGAGCALVAALTCTRRDLRMAGLAAAVVLVYLAHRTGSQAATALGAALVVSGGVLVARPHLARLLPPLAALVVVAVLVATVVLGAGRLVPGPVAEALSERRIVLWAEALDLLRWAPLSGVGAGRFAAVSPTAAEDTDARWAHSAWLQQAAETGLPGALLLLAVGLVAVLVGRVRGAVSAVGGAVVAALLVQASVDYVLHFPVLTALAAALRGLTVMPLAHSVVVRGNR